MLNTARRRQRRLRLLDLYGSLLTDHQRRIMHLAWEEDWSYGEIAVRKGVSRTAVYDLVRRTAGSLDGFERRLRLDREQAQRVKARQALRQRLAGLERQVGVLARMIEESA